MTDNKILYIGLNGFAGSGKDTVAKALRLMLSFKWESLDKFKEVWKSAAFKSNYATFGYMSQEDDECLCIAFADQLKDICSTMFGIPVERLYYNKETAWVAITTDFRYTETPPERSKLITAEELYYRVNSPNIDGEEKWMSLRELLVYVGTYVCQTSISKNCFINGVKNKVQRIASRNSTLRYVICTDVRFYREMEFIHNNYGININIVRQDVKQLDNIAEHDLDDAQEDFDFVIHNDGTYDDLLEQLWDLVHDNLIFKNITYSLAPYSHDGSDNYLRRIDEDEWQLVPVNEYASVVHSQGEIISVDPSGGPSLYTGMHLPFMKNKYIKKIVPPEGNGKGFIIKTENR